MTTGQAWQFRPYKWSEPRQLFHHGMCMKPINNSHINSCEVKGIYVSWSNDPPNPKIKDWNVSEIKVCFFVHHVRLVISTLMKIDPHRRHIDKSVVAHFWKMLDSWTMTNKPWLMTQ